MLLRGKSRVPDHIRRAIRLSVAILLLSSFGFSLVGRPGYEPYVMLIKWALLTCPVVTMPLLGKTSQVSFERALGTIVGGTLGFLCTALVTHWWTLQATEADNLFMAVVAAAAGFGSVVVGQRLSLDLSAKLFVLAFILVCFSLQEGRDPLVIALTRVGGIVTGVATMLIMSIIILPKSATMESLHTIRKALNKLQEVNRVAWGGYLPAGLRTMQSLGAAASGVASGGIEGGAGGGAGGGGRASNGGVPQQQRQGQRQQQRGQGQDSNGCIPEEPGTTGMHQPLLAATDGDDSLELGVGDVESGMAQAVADGLLEAVGGAACWSGTQAGEGEEYALKSEKALNELYSVLNQLAEQLSLAKTEVWMSSCSGHPFLLPGLPFWRRNARHLPWRELEQLATQIRRVARLLNTAIFTFEDGFDQQLIQALGTLYPPSLLPMLAAGCHAAIQELCDAFPCGQRVSGAGLAAYTTALQSLVEMSERQRRQVQGALRRHKSRAAARSSWAHIIDSVLEEQRSQAAVAGKMPTNADDAPQGQQASSGGPVDEPSGQASDGGAGASSAAAAAATPPQSQQQPMRRQAKGDGEVKQVGAASGSGHSSQSGQLGGSVDVVALAAAGVQHGSGLAELQAAPDGIAKPAGGAPLVSHLLTLRDNAVDGGGATASSGSLSLMLFPDTTQGRLAQVSFFSFMFLCEELRDQLEELHAAVDRVLCRLPG